jgi:hypothetical protein
MCLDQSAANRFAQVTCIEKMRKQMHPKRDAKACASKDAEHNSWEGTPWQQLIRVQQPGS